MSTKRIDEDPEPADKAAPEPEPKTIEERRAELEGECKELDELINETNVEIAKFRRVKDDLIAQKDQLITELQALRLSPAEEIQRHLRIQRAARAARTENIQAATAAIRAAGVPVGAEPAPIDRAMAVRPRQASRGAR